jgi:exonuclease VII large subunit
MLDEIVRYAAKTPSDAAHMILDGVEQMATRLDKAHSVIGEQIATRLDVYTNNIDQRYTQITRDIDRVRTRLADRIENRRAVIQLLDPKQQLHRGYALVTDQD